MRRVAGDGDAVDPSADHEDVDHSLPSPHASLRGRSAV
jgi:hypothetical protein